MTTEGEARAALDAAHGIRDHAEALGHETASAGPGTAAGEGPVPFTTQERPPDALTTAYALENEGATPGPMPDTSENETTG